MKNHQPYKLAFIDLDDTLLGPDKTISPDNLAALERLRAANVQIVIASGRHHRNITLFKDIGQQGWILSSHGSTVRHEQTREVLLSQTMDHGLTRHLFDQGRALGLSVIAYHEEGAFIEEESPWTEYYVRQSGWNPRRVDFESLPAEGFQKVLWSANPSQIDAIAPIMTRELSDRLYVVRTNPELLEFMAHSSNKSVGAQALTQKLGIPPERTLAFGDGHNDVELLAWAGLSVAMRHGKDSAHRAARFVSPAGPPESALARAVELALAA